MKTNDGKYSEKMFAFLDILGFARIVDESKSNPRFIGMIASMLADSKQIAESVLKTKLTILRVDSNEYAYHTFSDTIVISGPYASHDDMSFLSTWVMRYQHRMWKESQTFLRGAIVYGDIYHDKDVVFGPALIDAYHLERCNRRARWPRVLIDGSLFGKFTETERRRDFFEFLRRDDDELVYLDYLRELFHYYVLTESKTLTRQRANDFGAPVSLFEDHKRAILAQVDGALREENEDKRKRILEKYMELSRYHNSTVDKLRRAIKDTIELTGNERFLIGFFDDQKRSQEAKRTGAKYKPKYSIEEHPEQSDMLNILGAVINRTAKDPPHDILRNSGVVIVGETEDIAFRRLIRNVSREMPLRLSVLDKALLNSMIDINIIGLNV